MMIKRGGSRTAAMSKMEHFVIIVNGRKPLTIITKSSILDVAVVLDPPLMKMMNCFKRMVDLRTAECYISRMDHPQ